MRNTVFDRLNFLRAGAAVVAGGIVGCGGGSGGSGTPPPVPTPVPTAGNVAAVTIHPAITGTLTSMFVGLSYEKANVSSGLFTSANASLIGCFGRLGTSLLRFGGNTTDQTTWVGTGSGGVAGQVAPADINALATFLAATGWQVLYAINLGSNTPQNAAAEAAYVIQTLGSSLYAFEIGSQPDLYGTNGIRPSPYTFSDFLSEWQTYASQITAAVPGANLAGPATSSENVQGWTVPFAPAEASEITLLTQHYYRGNGTSASSTTAELLAGDPALLGDFHALRSAATGAKISGGYRMAETNSFSNGGALGVSDAYGSALWALDYIMIGAENGCAGFNFHGGGDSGGYTPIADSNNAVVDVRPEFYALLMVRQISPGSVLTVTTDTSLPFTAYAVAGGDGATYVVLVNKGASEKAVVSVTLPSSFSHGTTLALAGPNLDGTSGTTLGGAAVAPNGQWTPLASTPFAIGGTSFQLDVPAASALLVRCT